MVRLNKQKMPLLTNSLLKDLIDILLGVLSNQTRIINGRRSFAVRDNGTYQPCAGRYALYGLRTVYGAHLHAVLFSDRFFHYSKLLQLLADRRARRKNFAGSLERVKIRTIS
jgi:hypothetical protein